MKPTTTPPAGLVHDPDTTHEFTMQFTSTPRGAQLARRLVSHRLHEWGRPYDSIANETVTLIAAELVANAVRHGHVPGRDFHLRLTASPSALRIDVTDTRGERRPRPALRPSGPDDESGRDLLLVDALADRWGTTPRSEAPGKNVWAVLGVVQPDSAAAPVPKGVSLQGGTRSRPGNEPHRGQAEKAPAGYRRSATRAR
jgi:anti-sigma regulatory factor (Ser/Thr protein kinase)